MDKTIKKGNTLVETIAVMCILSILIISIPLSVSTIIKRDAKVDEILKINSFLDRSIQLLEDKTKTYFETNKDKVLTFKFHSIEDIMKGINNQPIAGDENVYRYEMRIKRANGSEEGLYLLKINVRGDVSEVTRETLLRGEDY